MVVNFIAVFVAIILIALCVFVLGHLLLIALDVFLYLLDCLFGLFSIPFAVRDFLRR